MDKATHKDMEALLKLKKNGFLWSTNGRSGYTSCTLHSGMIKRLKRLGYAYYMYSNNWPYCWTGLGGLTKEGKKLIKAYRKQKREG